jgi:hypothetical protein
MCLGRLVGNAELEACPWRIREQPPAKAGGFGLRLKAGSIGPSADYRHTTVKSSSGSGGC